MSVRPSMPRMVTEKTLFQPHDRRESPGFRPGTAPPVFIPERPALSSPDVAAMNASPARSAPPPVYRPKPVITQSKMAPPRSLVHRPLAPPVYRPQALQPHTAGASTGQAHPYAFSAGPAHRPVWTSSPPAQSLQRAVLAHAATGQPKTSYGNSHPKLIVQPKRMASPMSSSTTAPTVYRPHPTSVAQPMFFSKLFGSSSSPTSAPKGETIPEDTEKIRDISDGMITGYSPSTTSVMVIKDGYALAHVEIQEVDSGNEIMLHTRTEKGVPGSQGFMAVMFPDTLRIIKARFTRCQMINMQPAPGAATKGLISQLSRVRVRIPLQNPTRFASPRVSMARRFLDISAQARAARKRRESQSKDPKPELQEWNAEAMLETAHELNSLMEMEYASSTGLQIYGTTGTFAENLVGATTPTFQVPSMPGGALKWHSEGSKTKDASLLIKIPTASIQDYIDVLN